MAQHSNIPIEIAAVYREVFSSRKGQVVLFHMLEMLGFCQGVHTEEERVLNNYATNLLAIIGGGRFDQDSINEFTRRLMSQLIDKKKKEDE